MKGKMKVKSEKWKVEPDLETRVAVVGCAVRTGLHCVVCTAHPTARGAS
jgi:Zn-dependent alcohol dehydrogenase